MMKDDKKQYLVVYITEPDSEGERVTVEGPFTLDRAKKIVDAFVNDTMSIVNEDSHSKADEFSIDEVYVEADDSVYGYYLRSDWFGQELRSCIVKTAEKNRWFKEKKQ